ncbi:hypothetical protein ABPG75_000803 [Micractinium tetrahymenae]
MQEAAIELTKAGGLDSIQLELQVYVLGNLCEQLDSKVGKMQEEAQKATLDPALLLNAAVDVSLQTGFASTSFALTDALASSLGSIAVLAVSRLMYLGRFLQAHKEDLQEAEQLSNSAVRAETMLASVREMVPTMGPAPRPYDLQAADALFCLLPLQKVETLVVDLSKEGQEDMAPLVRALHTALLVKDEEARRRAVVDALAAASHAQFCDLMPRLVDPDYFEAVQRLASLDMHPGAGDLESLPPHYRAALTRLCRVLNESAMAGFASLTGQLAMLLSLSRVSGGSPRARAAFERVYDGLLKEGLPTANTAEDVLRRGRLLPEAPQKELNRANDALGRAASRVGGIQDTKDIIAEIKAVRQAEGDARLSQGAPAVDAVQEKMAALQVAGAESAGPVLPTLAQIAEAADYTASTRMARLLYTEAVHNKNPLAMEVLLRRDYVPGVGQI